MPNALAYYPNEKYISKNWAPEQVPVNALRALAKAQMLAQKNNILPPALAAALLPNSLVEGRLTTDEGSPSDFGFNYFGYPHAPEHDNAMMKMGLKVGKSNYPPKSVTDSWGDAEWENWHRTQPKLDVYKVDNGYTLNEDGESMDPSHSEDAAAKMAAIALAHKARLYGQDKAIERWNGQGSGARNHASKVQEMARMLNHPKNALLRQAYEQMMKGK